MVTVIILVAAAPGLRGHLTRWMIEPRAGVFVGNPTRRIRDRLWTLLSDRIGDGQAVMIDQPRTSKAGLSGPQDGIAGTPSTTMD